MVGSGQSQAGSVTSSTAPPGWEPCRYTNSRPGCVRSGSPRLPGPGEAADLAVAQAVEDEGEELAGDRHPGDVLAPAPADAGEVRAQLGPAPHVGHGFDGGPAHQRRSLLGDAAPPDL